MSILDNLLSNQAWYLSESGSTQLSALVARALEKREVSSDFTIAAAYLVNEKNEYISEEIINDAVAVYAMQGIISKYGSWWSAGSERILLEMQRNEKNDAVIAHVIDLNSSGGEAYFTGAFADAIRNQIAKPIYCHFNGMCCSAAYYLAAATDGIYASEGTDIVGSIGTMMSIFDFESMYEKMGVKIHNIYADPSSEKNQDIAEAKKGKYDRIKREMLNPFANAFIDSVKKHRPDMTDDDKVFKGATYTAANAPAGMIDGIKTLKEVVALAAEKGKEQKFYNKKNNVKMSVYKNILNAFTGVVDSEEVKAGLELGQKFDALTAHNTALQAQVAALTSERDNAAAQVTALQMANATLTTDRNTVIAEHAAVSAELVAERAKVKVGALGVPVPAASSADEVPAYLLDIESPLVR